MEQEIRINDLKSKYGSFKVIHELFEQLCLDDHALRHIAEQLEERKQPTRPTISRLINKHGEERFMGALTRYISLEDINITRLKQNLQIKYNPKPKKKKKTVTRTIRIGEELKLTFEQNATQLYLDKYGTSYGALSRAYEESMILYLVIPEEQRKKIVENWEKEVK